MNNRINDKLRAEQGEVVGGGFFVFRRGMKWGRVRFVFKPQTKQIVPFEHPTMAAAVEEATRLAEKNRGHKYSVFQEVAHVMVP